MKSQEHYENMLKHLKECNRILSEYIKALNGGDK